MDQAERLRNMVKSQTLKEEAPEQKKNARLIAVTSGKGGVGKSNTSINIALCLKKLGKKVIILDADFGLANIEVMFGVIPKYTLADLMFNGKDLKDIVMEGPEGVGFISGGSGITNLSNIGGEDVKKVVDKLWELDSMADVVIIDTGAGMSPSVLEFLAASPEIILVTTPEPTSITDAYALIKSLNLYPGFEKSQTHLKLVANKVMSTKEANALYDKLNSVVGRFLDIRLEWLGCVPQDNCISKSVMKQKPVCMTYPSSAAAKAYNEIAQKILKDDTVSSGEESAIRGFFGKLLHRN
jgi:flagellar biosynthesis protein FlhG